MRSLIMFLASGVLLAANAQNVHCESWGENGELWRDGGSLPFVAYAGFAEGMEEIPEYPVTANVRNFGGKGDGQTDDTEAFKKAIAATASGAILVPAGRYVIRNFITLNKPGLVLRGEGENSVLYFPEPLDTVKPNWGATTTGQRTSNYSWSGGYVQIQGSAKTFNSTPIKEAAKRGDRSFRTASSVPFKPGDYIEILLQDTAGKTLFNHIYNEDPGNTDKVIAPGRIVLPARIVAVEPVGTGSVVRLDRPLRLDLRPEWNPTVARIEYGVTRSGLERLAFEFPPVQWNGEFKELGYNAILLGRVKDCWVRNLHLHNAEGGIFCGARNSTVSDILFTNNKPPFTRNLYLTKKGCQGHHGISVGGSDNLIQRFDFGMRYVHDLTVAALSNGNVFSNGRGDDLCFDHHKRGPFENLFTHLDCGEGNRIWRCGGGADLGRHSAGYETFWNLKAAKPLPPPPIGWGPKTLNVIGVTTSTNSIYRTLVVPEGKTLFPGNLYEAQKKHFSSKR